MTKKRPTYTCPQLIPRKKKDMLKIVKNPEAMRKLIELNKAASEVLEKKAKIRALTVEEWFERVFAILPEKYDSEELKNKIKTCFTEGINDDSHNERKSGNNEGTD